MAERLANGNTLVTSYRELRAVELDPAGKEVWQYPLEHARESGLAALTFLPPRPGTPGRGAGGEGFLNPLTPGPLTRVELTQP